MVNGNLLIVEDEAALAEILEEMLSPLCAEIYSAANGKEAIEILKTKSVHTIISDINMPIMSGFQLLNYVRSAGYITPFITLTAYGDQDNMRESIKLNATDFMTKPFDRKELLEVVSKSLQTGLKLQKIESEIETLFKDHLKEETLSQIEVQCKALSSARIENSKHYKNIV